MIRYIAPVLLLVACGSSDGVYTVPDEPEDKGKQQQPQETESEDAIIFDGVWDGRSKTTAAVETYVTDSKFLSVCAGQTRTIETIATLYSFGATASIELHVQDTTPRALQETCCGYKYYCTQTSKSYPAIQQDLAVTRSGDTVTLKCKTQCDDTLMGYALGSSRSWVGSLSSGFSGEKYKGKSYGGEGDFEFTKRLE